VEVDCLIKIISEFNSEQSIQINVYVDKLFNILIEKYSIAKLQNIVITDIDDSCNHTSVYKWANLMKISTNSTSSVSGQGWERC